MKVPPKRKGNGCRKRLARSAFSRLNESPSEKEGKFLHGVGSECFYCCLNESPSEKEGK